MPMNTSYDTVVVGGGQAGLATGYYLAQQKGSFVILDENDEVGAVWRQRWDSLRLFTPSQFDSLPGLPFPKADGYYPTKDDLADYLVAYADAHQLPVQLGVRANALRRTASGYVLSTDMGPVDAENVVVATGGFQKPNVPHFASELSPDVTQFHTKAYRNPDQITGETVLVVGAGNSGTEIALEVAQAGYRVWLSGPDVGHLPGDFLGRFLGGRPFWWLIDRVLSVNTPVGRKMKSQILSSGAPVERVSEEDLVEAGIERTPRVSGVEAGAPRLEDDRRLPVETVIWATGFRPDFHWIALSIFDTRGYPRQDLGVVADAPGLYFVGLLFQRAITSALVGGVGTDAKYIVEHLAHRRS